MKKVHYVNLGTMKTGTTYLYNELLSHPEIDCKHPVKEFHFFTRKFADVRDYARPYEDYDISCNFSTEQWKIQPKLIKILEEYATHSSIIFRNPYEYVLSNYNYMKQIKITDKDHSFDQYFDQMVVANKLIDYAAMVKKWNAHLTRNKLQIFYYEDLLRDPQDFYNTVTDQFGISKKTVSSLRINTTRYIEHPDFNKSQISYVNECIEKFEQLVNKDFTRWKKECTVRHVSD